MSSDRDTFGDIWQQVLVELTADDTLGDSLTRQQKAWLSLVQPLTLAEGFALLAVPSALVQEQIERTLREPIRASLSRHLGAEVDLGVRIDPDAASASAGPQTLDVSAALDGLPDTFADRRDANDDLHDTPRIDGVLGSGLPPADGRSADGDWSTF